MSILLAPRVDPTVRVLTSLPDLTQQAAPLLTTADSFFLTASWWRAMVGTGIKNGTTPQFLVHDAGGLFPMQTRDCGKILESFTNPYTCYYRPLIGPDLDQSALFEIGRDFARQTSPWASVRMEALPDPWPGQAAILEGMRSLGRLPIQFDHFGNWYEPVAGIDWNHYLEQRSGQLRETIRRKLRRLERDADTRHDIVTDPADIEAAIDIYRRVYALSWKVPEPYPDFNPAMMREAAAAGALRLGILHAQGAPRAVQIWLVQSGIATVVKLAHDENFRAHSPGTVLTALMIRHLLEHERLTELDFGRGDDDYKKLWASRRRQRIGLTLINPKRAGGLLIYAMSLASRARRALRKKG